MKCIDPFVLKIVLAQFMDLETFAWEEHSSPVSIVSKSMLVLMWL